VARSSPHGSDLRCAQGHPALTTRRDRIWWPDTHRLSPSGATWPGAGGAITCLRGTRKRALPPQPLGHWPLWPEFQVEPKGRHGQTACRLSLGPMTGQYSAWPHWHEAVHRADPRMARCAGRYSRFMGQGGRSATILNHMVTKFAAGGRRDLDSGPTQIARPITVNMRQREGRCGRHAFRYRPWCRTGAKWSASCAMRRSATGDDGGGRHRMAIAS